MCSIPKKQPANPCDTSLLATFCACAGSHENVCAGMRKLIIEHPGSPDLWYRFAIFLHNQCNTADEVVSALTRAQDLSPELDLRLRMGDTLIRYRNTKKGFRYMCEFLKDHPSSFAYRLLGRHLLRHGSLHRARKFLRKSFVMDSDNCEIYYLLGEVAFKCSKRDAISLYTKSISMDKENPEAWKGLGIALLDDPAFRADGISALKKASELDPSDPWLFLCLGVGHWLIGKPEDADIYYRKAIELAPTDELYKEYYDAFLSRGESGVRYHEGGW